MKTQLAIIFLALTLAACGPRELTEEQVTQTAFSFEETRNSWTATPTITPTPTPTYTPTPTSTFTPTPTPTPTVTPTLVGGFPGQYIAASGSQEDLRLNLYDANGRKVEELFDFPDELGILYTRTIWSPDGESLAVLYWQDGGYLVLLTHDGEILRTIDTDLHSYGGYIRQANWAPDSSNLVFAGKVDNSYYDIYLLSSDGEELIQFNNTYTKDTSPRFSPDGSQIIFYNGNNLTMVDLAGNYIRTLPAGYRDWSPDGRYIAYAANEDLYAFDLVENRSIRLTYDGTKWYQSNALISPDSKWVYYHMYNWMNWRNWLPSWGMYLYRSPIDGSSEPELIAITSSYRFSPDGTLLLFQGYLTDTPMYGDPKYYAMRLDNSEIIPLTSFAAPMVHNEWKPFSTSSTEFDSRIFFGPTPVPSWPAQTDLNLIDDFESGELNSEIWDIDDAVGTDTYDMVVTRGEFVLQGTRTNRDKSVEVQMKQTWTGEEISAIEAKMSLRGNSGGTGYSALQNRFYAGTNYWIVRCRMGDDLYQPVYFCDVSRESTNSEEMIYRTVDRPIRAGIWYTARIEVDTETGTMQFFLDEENLGTYSPPFADSYLSTQIHIGLTAWSDGWISAYFDDLRIGD